MDFEEEEQEEAVCNRECLVLGIIEMQKNKCVFHIHIYTCTEYSYDRQTVT